MKTTLIAVATLASIALAGVAIAQAPAGSTGQCKDGTYTDAATKSGACSGHGGVKTWNAERKAEAKPSKDAPAKAAAAPAPAPAKAAAPAAAASSTKAKKTEKPSDMPTVAAPGGGPGKVWVNTSSKVYHCMGDEWYGKTKKGEYMTEAQAKSKGSHAANNKACN